MSDRALDVAIIGGILYIALCVAEAIWKLWKLTRK